MDDTKLNNFLQYAKRVEAVAEDTKLEIVVRAERDESVVDEPAPAAPRYEVIKDYANDRYGFYVYLGKNKSLPFRIFFKDHSAKEIHNR